MLVRTTSSNPQRRRLLGGLAVLGLYVLTSGCDRRLSFSPTPVAGVRRAEPTPLPPARPPVSPSVLVGATFGKVLMLEGVTVDSSTVKAGDYLRIWLHWQSIAHSQDDLRSIGRVVTTGARVVASEDDQIGGRKRHLSRWSVGERVIDEMRLRVTPSLLAGEYGLAIGVLRPDNVTAVPVTSHAPSAVTWQEDAVMVGTVDVLTG